MTTQRPIRTKRQSKGRDVALTHPGEILRKDFLEAFGITQYRLAKDTRVPPRRINEIVNGTRGITADTALRLSIYFGTTPAFWLNLQSHYEIEVLRERHGVRIEHDVKPRSNEAA